ncbi:MAG TPA: hypothetical protein VG502_06810 [Flexivirga sp.]|uniref:hypothetical protein n=1 Tax=Flexivirga sp. TaxID=1962927 RepID=UPI002CBC3385|nr:hypothetical protein [Flexivirga sp.]HWC21994.1 hypothetical protein [Flexivirga sp.]
MDDQPKPSLTDLVWHYTDAAGLLSILRTDTVWATSSEFLNDRGEVQLGRQLAEERMRERARLEPDSIYGRLGGLLRANDERNSPPEQDGAGAIFFVLSASSSPDSLAMWRNYGGAGESYAVGLDPARPLRVLGELAGEEHEGGHGMLGGGVRLRRKPWRAVHYDRPSQLSLIDHVLDDRAGTAEKLRQAAADLAGVGDAEDLRRLLSPARRDDLERMLGDLEDVLLLIKHPGFIDEDEVRASYVLWLQGDRGTTMHALRDVIQYRASRYGLAPYLRLTGPGDDPEAPLSARPCPLPIRAVTVSPSAHGAAAEQSVRDLLAAGGRADVPVTRSGIPFRE